MKILLVEDDPFFQKFYSMKLKESNFEVAVASDGQQALQSLQTAPPNLMLLDLIMPNLDGFGVLEAMHANPALQKIPVIVFSTLGQEQDIQKAKSLGAVDYVNKSFFDYDNLLRRIFAILQGTPA
jgi:CheY-like chemotaxis protein